MGSATLSPSGAFEAGSFQTFTLTYTAGRFGLDDTGSLKIAFRFASDMGALQFDDPEAPGYTTIEASNGAILEPKWEFKRNIRPWSKSLYIGVKKHFLAEGDTITIRFGDKRFGSPGVRLQTFCEAEYQFKVFTDAIATYDYVSLPVSPAIAIVPGPPVTWKAYLPTLVATDTDFRLSIKADDKWGNPSNLINQTLTLEASKEIDGLPATIPFNAGEFACIIENLKLKTAGDVIVTILDETGKELTRTNPLRVQDNPAHLHFWGDIHGQSNETLGTNTAEEYFTFGRDKSFLDVCGHQGNDFQITSKFWDELNDITKKLNQTGRYICFPGYEWSANTAVGGDRNIFYRKEGGPIYRSSHAQIDDMSDEQNDVHNAHQLFAALKDQDVVMYAHCGGRYADITYAHDGRLETSIEIHSAWGTFEWLLHDAFKMNYRIGIVANSDGHKGRVGASHPGASFFGAYGGFTCFLADDLSRDGIFECQRRRHHYGTTGTRLYLSSGVDLPAGSVVFDRDPDLFDTAKSVSATAAIMGDIVQAAGDEVEFHIEVLGSAPIESIELRNGPEVLEKIRPYDEADLGSRIRVVYEGAEYRGRGRAVLWNGSASINGNKIKRAQQFNNWNLDRGLTLTGENTLNWSAVTTGNFGGFDLWLEDETAGTITIETAHVNAEINIADIGLKPAVYTAGGIGKALKIYRLPDTMTTTHVRHSKTVRLNDTGDTRLYVCITQEDGHQAWSSPIYLFR